ncbi:MAG: uridine diphosphate-N-acetylglucosamine-binding protein YvcK [Candidatus Promineifilaceae bacterium]|nr:uridine diphosphate-N-acetylglucosamine-binding protein YvcK [Candidatus Promineifilaceae bacterium]
MSERNSLPDVWAAWRNWLALGIGVKRWLVVLAVGAIVAGMGIASLVLLLGRWEAAPPGLYRVISLAFLPTWLRVILPLVIGAGLSILAVNKLASVLVAPFRKPDEDLARSLRHYSARNRGPRIVAIGGGTGLPGLLRGLSEYTSNLTAIVTVADDGGSSGRLRRELGLLPPGDFRNNIAALARDEALMTQLLQYRFMPQVSATRKDAERTELQGHAFGNILLAALTGVTGSFEEALTAIGRVLAMRGRVLPSTLIPIVLIGNVVNASTGKRQRVEGESAIPKIGGRIERVSLEPEDAPAYPPAVQAILQADLVVIGPGSLYTSILPNLLVDDLAQALQRSQAKRVFVCNLATQPGETDNYDVADHVAAVSLHVAQKRSGRSWADVVLANDNLAIPPETGGGETVFVVPGAPRELEMVTADLVDEARPWRHDSQKLASAVMALLRQPTRLGIN